MANGRSPMDGRNTYKEGQHVNFLEASLGLERLKRRHARHGRKRMRRKTRPAFAGKGNEDVSDSEGHGK
jgi:hypothetical protein